jgi:hypothetical protein
VGQRRAQNLTARCATSRPRHRIAGSGRTAGAADTPI